MRWHRVWSTNSKQRNDPLNREAADEHAEALRSIIEPIANLSTRRIAAILNFQISKLSDQRHGNRTARSKIQARRRPQAVVHLGTTSRLCRLVEVCRCDSNPRELRDAALLKGYELAGIVDNWKKFVRDGRIDWDAAMTEIFGLKVKYVKAKPTRQEYQCPSLQFQAIASAVSSSRVTISSGSKAIGTHARFKAGRKPAHAPRMPNSRIPRCG